MKSKEKKITYKQLLSYVNYLENKLNYNINILSKTVDHYIRFNKHDKKFMKYLEKTVNKDEKQSTEKDIKSAL